MRSRPFRPFALAAFSLVAFGLAGCDEATTDTFPFTVDGLSYTFSFESEQVDGTALTVSAQGSESILDEISAEGFGPDDVVSVQLTEAQILLLQPINGDIGFLDDVSLRLEGGGESVEVASAEDIDQGTTMTGEADLDVSNENIADIATAGDMEATLTVSADSDIPEGTYRLEVRFDVRVEVQDF